MSPNPSSGFQDQLPPEVTVVRDWPTRTAIMLGSEPYPQISTALNRAGFAPLRATTDNALDVVIEAGPFTFLFFGPEAVSEAYGPELIKSLHGLSPSARVMLVGRADTLPAAVLLAAMQAGITDIIDPEDTIGLNSMIARQLERAGVQRERVLAIGAHPDDVEIGCAGTLLDHRRRGDRISVFTLSRGAIGGDQRARFDEALAAASLVGAQLLMGDLPDTEIDAGVATIRLIEAVVRAIDPTVVYVHSKNDNHQDHRAAHITTVSSTRRVPRVFAYQSPSATNDFSPTKFVAVDNEIARKVEVLALFDSQNERSYLEPDLVIAGARYWARQLAPRAKYAEPFEVVRALDSAISVPSPRIGTHREDVPRPAAIIPMPSSHAGGPR
jgi:LmbE family N-acetylglucosaminyl deacetylase